MRKKHWSLREELVAAVLAMLISGFFCIHVLHFAHRNDADREVWTRLPLWQTLEAFEYRLYDARFSSRGIREPDSLDKIAVVGVDESTTERLPSWPIPRRLHAQLIDRLHAAGARVIALDFDFSQPQDAKNDAALETAMEKAGNVLMASLFTSETIEGKKENSKTEDEARGELAMVARTTTPIERFDQWTPDLSLVYVPRDSDGRVRRYPFVGAINGTNVGSLATLACAKYQGLLDDTDNKKYEAFLKAQRWPGASGKVVYVPVMGSRVNRKNKDAPLVFTTPFNYWGPAKTFNTYSYADVLEGNFSPEQMRQQFGGKIVFVGATAPILKDVFEMPSFTRQDGDSELNEIPGVELHATAAAMLLDGSYIRTASTPTALAVLYGLTLGASLWAAVLQGLVSRKAREAQVWWTQHSHRGQIHTLVWFALYLALGALPLILYWLAAQWVFTYRNLWVIESYPMLSAGISTALVLFYLFGIEAAERRKTQAHFARAVSPQLMDKMVASGEDYLAPEEIYLTVLFTDLEGFTTYSESHPPKEVIDVTNDFLSAVVPIIHKYDGWVDKYIGDAIMAVFGAPVEREDHAAVALRCAVEMQDAAAAWRKKTGIGFYMRVGIHTGEVIAGSMGSRATSGSRERMDYTVIGDTVNLASRLEGKNKEYGSWIMCSSQTFQDAPGIVSAHSVSASIKGKSQEVQVFIVRGLIEDPERDKNWGKDVTP